MLSHYFLTQNEKNKIHLYDAVFRNPDQNLNSIAKQLGWSYQQTYYTAQKLPIKLRHLTETSWQTPAEYTNTILRKTICYQTIYSAIIDERPLNIIAEEQSCSLVTVARHLRQLNTYLSQIGLKQRSKQNSMQGDERQIRLFYWYTLDHVHEKSLTAIPEARKIADLLQLKCQIFPSYRLNNLLVIFTQRLRQAHFIGNNHQAVGVPHVAIEYCAQFFGIPEIQAERELSWLKYILTNSPYAALDEANLKFSDVHLAQRIYATFSDEQLPLTSANLLYIAALLNYSKQERLSMISDVDLSRLRSETDSTNMRYCLANSTYNQDELLPLLTDNLLPSLKLDHFQCMTTIYLTPELELGLRTRINTILDHLFNQQVISTTESTRANFLVLTNVPANTKPTNIYYWSHNASENENLAQLFSQISHSLFPISQGTIHV